MSVVAPRVLILEPDPEISFLESMIVGRCGCAPCFATTGAEALELLRRDPPDVILLGSPVETEGGDLVLDGLAGPLRAFGSRTIVLTTYTENVDLLTRAAKANVYAVVGKPFDIDVVADLIRQCAFGGVREAPTKWIGVSPSALARVSPARESEAEY